MKCESPQPVSLRHGCDIFASTTCVPTARSARVDTGFVRRQIIHTSIDFVRSDHRLEYLLAAGFVDHAPQALEVLYSQYAPATLDDAKLLQPADLARDRLAMRADTLRDF